MVPTIAQQLRGVQAALTKTIVPALPADDSFVQEQAGLALATLAWVLDVQADETLYEATERAEYRDLLTALDGLGSVPADPASAVPSGGPDAIPDLVAVRAETRALKSAVEARFAAVTADGSDEEVEDARRLMLQAAERQAVREQSWFRMTGFPADVAGDVRSVLESRQGGGRS
ncbi:MAG: hypothetical protein AB7G37_10135 [Solirubrobacteraceae bacterium]